MGRWPGAPHALDHQRHLVRDLAHVGVRLGQDGETAPVAGGRDEEERLVQFDDGLADPAGVEVVADALGEAVEAGGDGGEVLAVLTGQVRRRAGGESVAGEHQRLADAGDALDEFVEQPVQLARAVACGVVCCGVRCGHRPSPPGVVPRAVPPGRRCCRRSPCCRWPGCARWCRGARSSRRSRWLPRSACGRAASPAGARPCGRVPPPRRVPRRRRCPRGPLRRAFGGLLPELAGETGLPDAPGQPSHGLRGRGAVTAWPGDAGALHRTGRLRGGRGSDAPRSRSAARGGSGANGGSEAPGVSVARGVCAVFCAVVARRAAARVVQGASGAAGSSAGSSVRRPEPCGTGPVAFAEAGPVPSSGSPTRRPRSLTSVGGVRRAAGRGRRDASGGPPPRGRRRSRGPAGAGRGRCAGGGRPVRGRRRGAGPGRGRCRRVRSRCPPGRRRRPGRGLAPGPGRGPAYGPADRPRSPGGRPGPPVRPARPGRPVRRARWVRGPGRRTCR